MDDIRQANIGIAVGAVIMFVGAFIFRNAGDGALQLVGAASFIATFAVYFTLQARMDKRSGRRGGKDLQ
ncbi:MAG TPA: hypothetical protein VG898_01375 [Solirubrobacterales bacterium]|nr:hypothetical protein [Solirubrobacterales bacterium]